MEKVLDIGRKIIPKKIFKTLQPYYHFCLSLLGAVIYGFPAKKLTIIGVTGTKGKSTTTEVMNKILEENGFKTILSSTIKTRICAKEERNLSKMTTRGRFFTQRLLRKGLDKGAKFAVLEISSEATLRFGHKFLFLDCLIFTNLSPEHIEAHGSYENYRNAKLNIAKELENSEKNTCIVANIDDKEAEKFLSIKAKNKISYSLSDAVGVKSDENGSDFQIGKMVIHSKLPGIFNVSNMLGCIGYARFIGIKDEVIKRALESIDVVKGRMEKIKEGQNFDVVVDYAHTKESLASVYKTYFPHHKLICILGNTGGGRDKWKRPEMAKIAEEYCSQIILTNEDPYDEDPKKIIDDMVQGITNKEKVEIIIDRREAIRKALTKAKEIKKEKLDEKIAVLITGKGTDPYIMGPRGTKESWDDATVTREELIKIMK